MASPFLPEESLLLIYARISMPPELQKRVEKLLSSRLDWERLLALALDHDVGGLLYWNLKRANQLSFMPTEIRDTLTALYRDQFALYLIFASELERLLPLFDQAKVPVIILKGMALTENLYGDPGLRPAQDIDLLIHKQDWLKADRILRNEGYLIDHSHDEKVVWQHSYLHWEKHVAVDLHWHITTVYNFNRTTGINLAEMWAGAKKFSIGDASTLVFNPEDQLIYLAVHLAVHHNFDTLIKLCDINQVVIRYKGILDWAKLIRKARTYQVKNMVYFSLYFAKTLLDSPVPRWALIRLRPNRRRRRDFLSGIVSPETYFHPDTRPRLHRTRWYESLQALADDEQQVRAIQTAGEEFQRLYGESAQVERARALNTRIMQQTEKNNDQQIC